MLFNLQSDTGEYISGYLVPDDFSSVPSLNLSSNGKTVLNLTAQERLPVLVASGRHETGLCGFSISEENLPGLRNMHDLAIFDAATQLLVYRRPKPSDIHKKIFRLETQLLPFWTLDAALGPQFQYFSHGVENLGRESVTQLFLLDFVPSVYLSGRILYKTYVNYIEAGFETILTIQEPYQELAERLYVLSKVNKLPGGKFGLRDTIEMRETIKFAEALIDDDQQKRDDKSLGRALRRMPFDVAATLSSPLVRLLTSSTPEEMPGKGAVASALDLLVSASVIGLRHEQDHFGLAVGELLNIEPGSLPKLPQIPQCLVFAERLKNSGAVDLLLERDLELYHYITDAANRVLASAV